MHDQPGTGRGALTGPLPLDAALAQFLRILTATFGHRLHSVILYGSAVYDDLAPGYGDLDYLVVVDGDLSEQVCGQLAALREPLRRGEFGPLAAMLEGAFLPRHMLDPAQEGLACWWGTQGERTWTRNELGWLALHAIRKQGIVIWGADVRSEIPAVRRKQLLEGVWDLCRDIEVHGRGGGLHAVDWLLSAARALLLLREGRLASKSAAADWAHAHAPAAGAWQAQLPRAKRLRLEPALAGDAAWRGWLSELTGPIREAGEELRRELERQGFRARSR